MATYLTLIEIDHHSMVPKYIQLSEHIIHAVSSGHLTPGGALPSLHEFSVMLDISKGTVEKCYKHLKAIGLVGSYPGKGFFIDAGFKSRLEIRLNILKSVLADTIVLALMCFALTEVGMVVENDLG